jgi:3-oxoacyl-[acyl-carrier-protein] synthase-3
MKAIIKSLGAYAPANRVSNDDLSKTMDTSDEWIFSHTGIRYRHISAENEAASDVAVPAARQALERAALKPEEVELILFATCTGDYNGFPSCACILQDRLGALNAGCLDIAAACTGFIYGLEIAKNFILSGTCKNVLLVAGEVMTKIINWQDRNTCVLFGDGAGAAVVTGEEGGRRGILSSILRAEGQGAEVLKRPAGGTRRPYREGQVKEEDFYLAMDGKLVYNFAVRTINEVIRETLEKNKLSIDDVAYIVPHQANVRIIQAACKREKIPLEKFYLNIEEYANTSAASIPLALNEMFAKNLIKPDDLIITVGFGGGLTYGGNLIRF